MGGMKRVLIVDYHPGAADSLAQVFLQRGCEARVFHAGEPALKFAEEWPPEIAVLELILADKNGLEAAMYPSGCALIARSF